MLQIIVITYIYFCRSLRDKTINETRFIYFAYWSLGGCKKNERGWQIQGGSAHPSPPPLIRPWHHERHPGLGQDCLHGNRVANSPAASIEGLIQHTPRRRLRMAMSAVENIFFDTISGTSDRICVLTDISVADCAGISFPGSWGFLYVAS